jgi:hypothetical protein
MEGIDWRQFIGRWRGEPGAWFKALTQLEPIAAQSL